VFVLTIDQRRSRREGDRVGDLLADLAASLPPAAVVLPFERTVGDEVQGALGEPTDVVTVVLDAACSGHWSVGVGLGDVDRLATSARESSGPAFTRARDAVERAKRDQHRIAVTGSDDAAADAEAVLRLLASVITRRSEAGHEAAALVAAGHTHAEVAEHLGVSRQAVGQRLRAAAWREEQAVRPVAARLLAHADLAARAG
jgi:hypothetical protein